MNAVDMKIYVVRAAPERNTLRPQENVVVLLKPALPV
jgi:hypothetical protein